MPRRKPKPKHAVEVVHPTLLGTICSRCQMRKRHTIPQPDGTSLCGQCVKEHSEWKWER